MITNWFDKKENSRDTWNRRPDHWARVYLAAAPAFAWIAFSPLCQPHRRCIPRCEFSCALTSFDFVFHQLRRPTLCKHGTRRAHRLIVNLVLEVFFRCSSKTAKKEPIIMIKTPCLRDHSHSCSRWRCCLSGRRRAPRMNRPGLAHSIQRGFLTCPNCLLQRGTARILKQENWKPDTRSVGTRSV